MKKIMMSIAAGLCALHCMAALPSSTEYVSDGLVAHWDGIDNTLQNGVRSHSDNPSQWDDLTGNGNYWPIPQFVTAESDAFYSQAYKSKTEVSVGSNLGQWDYAKISSINGLNATIDGDSIYTVEVVAQRAHWRLTDRYTDNQWIIATPRGNLGYYSANATDNCFCFSTVHSQSKLRCVNEWRPSGAIADEINTMTLQCGKINTTSNVRINNDSKKDGPTSGNSAGWNSGFTIFHNKRADIRIHAIRIYNRELTSEERAINLKLDRARFGKCAEPLMDFVRTVDYIESTGSQYIDTGYLPNPNTRLELDVMFSGFDTSKSGTSIFGARDGDNVNFHMYIGNTPPTTSTSANFKMHSNNTSNQKQIFFKGDTYESRQLLTIDVATGSMSYGTITANCDVKNNTHSSRTLTLFARKNADNSTLIFNRSNMRLFGCRIWDGQTLVRDFVPSYRPFDYQAGLYDKVKGKFYCNEGTNPFKFGDKTSAVLPTGYRSLDYIVANGNQKISTGINAAGDVSMIMEFTPFGGITNMHLWGARNKTLSQMTGSELSYEVFLNTNNVWECRFADGAAEDTPGGLKELQANERQSFTLDALGNGFYANGNKKVALRQPKLSAGGEITLLKTHDSALTKGRLYSTQIWKGNNVVRQLTPALCESDGTIGMYDLANDTFYQSSGEDSFLASPEADVGMPCFFGTQKNAGLFSQANYPGLSDFSFSVWVRNPSAGNYNIDGSTSWPHAGLIMGQGALGYAGFCCYIETDVNGKSTLRIQTRLNKDTMQNYSMDNAQLLCDDKWHHIVFSHSATDSLVKLYVDGKEVISSTDVISPGNDTKQFFTIGNTYSAKISPYCGEIAYVSLWNCALAKDKIIVLRSRPAKLTDFGLVDAWTLDCGDSGLTGIVTGNRLSPVGDFGYDKCQIKWVYSAFSIMLR